MSVPTYGAILLTSDLKNCLLVQSFFAKNSWSYPKGKVNENEDPVKCAIREVYEETGFDCSQLINEHAFIEGQTSNYQYTRLYIVKNVPVETKFCPRTRNEIKDCSWFTVDELPTTRNDDGYFKDQRKIRANSFYMILPFISKLKHWIANERLAKVIGNKKKRQQQQQQLQKGNKHVISSNKKNAVHIKALPNTQQSPFFQNNVNVNLNNGDHLSRNARARHKSADDIIDHNNIVNGSPASSNGNSTFYNDNNPKMQNNTSTPINTLNSSNNNIIINNNNNTSSNAPLLLPSSSSAFRATNNISNSFKKKLHIQKSSSAAKVNGIIVQNYQPQLTTPTQEQQQQHYKRRLFSETKENMTPQKSSSVAATVKPFALDIPDSWKNFKFDHQKIFNSICM